MEPPCPIFILVTGASIAGNTLAFWLDQHGQGVTVVERAPEFRDDGQNVNVSGRGREVLKRMGLDDAALARGTGEEGTAWVGTDGRVKARFRLDPSKGYSMTSEMEILRVDLARLMWEAARGKAAFRFGDTIAAVAPETAR